MKNNGFSDIRSLVFGSLALYLLGGESANGEITEIHLSHDPWCARGLNKQISKELIRRRETWAYSLQILPLGK